MTIYKNLGKKIRKMRLSQGLSQEQLAEACCLSTSYISCIERGTKKINLAKLEKLSYKLDFIIDIYSPKNKFSSNIDAELLYLLSNCSNKDKAFLNKVVKIIILGIETNKFDWQSNLWLLVYGFLMSSFL